MCEREREREWDMGIERRRRERETETETEFPGNKRLDTQSYMNNLISFNRIYVKLYITIKTGRDRDRQTDWQTSSGFFAITLNS